MYVYLKVCKVYKWLLCLHISLSEADMLALALITLTLSLLSFICWSKIKIKYSFQLFCVLYFFFFWFHISYAICIIIYLGKILSQQKLNKQILVPQTFKHRIIESYYMSVISCLNDINQPHCHHNRRRLILGEKYFRKRSC